MIQHDDVRIGDNPTTDSITALIGEDLMRALSYHLGGKIVYIQNTATPNSPLAAAIGIEAAKRVSDVYGGMKFEVPNRIGRDIEVLALHKAGVSNIQIAHQMRLTRKTVASIIERHEHERHPRLL